MSINLSTSGIITGFGLMCYGGYKCLTQSGTNPNAKRSGLALIVTGLAIAIFAKIAHSEEIPQESPETVDPEILQLLQQNIEDNEPCPISRLKYVLRKFGVYHREFGSYSHKWNSLDKPEVIKLFNVLAEIQKISCRNYLKWQDNFLNKPFDPNYPNFITNIKPSDLTQSVMWGIDKWNRSFVAIKYVAASAIDAALQAKEEMVAIFHQLHTDRSSITTSYDLSDKICGLSRFFVGPDSLQMLRDFVKNGSLISHFDNTYCTIELAK